MNIYVGNLPREVTETELMEAFQAFGDVASAKIITDRLSGESRGFAFVEMSTDGEAEEAITGLNGKDMKGRTLNVNKARPRPDRDRGRPRPSW
ncbi:MAG: RNA recognition motif domain-containing protein [Thermoplasmata archaeon]